MPKRLITYLLLGLSTFVVISCGRAVTPQKSNPITIGNYDEDLETVRIKYETKLIVTPTENKNYKEKKVEQVYKFPQQVNQKVDIALDSMSVRNKSIKYTSGFRIQVYVGNEKKEMEEAKIFLFQNYPELNTYLSYSQPSYKLKVGDFTSKLEAEKYYQHIKERYSLAMIINDKIEIKSLQSK